MPLLTALLCGVIWEGVCVWIIFPLVTEVNSIAEEQLYLTKTSADLLAEEIAATVVHIKDPLNWWTRLSCMHFLVCLWLNKVTVMGKNGEAHAHF